MRRVSKVNAMVVQTVKASAYKVEDPGSIPGREDPLEKETATHSSILVWNIPWTAKPGRLQPMGSQESDVTERLSMDSPSVLPDPSLT